MELAPLSSLVPLNNGSKAECYKFISLEINAATFHFGVDWKDQQVASCAEMLYENYHYLSGGDWFLFFKRLFRSTGNVYLYQTFMS